MIGWIVFLIYDRSDVWGVFFFICDRLDCLFIYDRLDVFLFVIGWILFPPRLLLVLSMASVRRWHDHRGFWRHVSLFRPLIHLSAS